MKIHVPKLPASKSRLTDVLSARSKSTPMDKVATNVWSHLLPCLPITRWMVRSAYCHLSSLWASSRGKNVNLSLPRRVLSLTLPVATRLSLKSTVAWSLSVASTTASSASLTWKRREVLPSNAKSTKKMVTRARLSHSAKVSTTSGTSKVLRTPIVSCQ